MTLHETIEKLLKEKGRAMSIQEIADALNMKAWYRKKDGSLISAFQIHRRTNNYPQYFTRNGSMVYLAGKEIIRIPKKVTPSDKGVLPRKTGTGSTRLSSDENYVLNLCDKVLILTCSRQHRFDFLTGDTNAKGFAYKLPVDGYYETIRLAIEYREQQHIEAIRFFDKPDKMTVSGVNRGEQRKLYDERRRQVLPAHGIKLVEFEYSDFVVGSGKRIVRDETRDLNIVRKKLMLFIKYESSFCSIGP